MATLFSGSSDEDLVRIYLAGNEQGFNALYARYRGKIEFYIFLLVRDRSLSEDLAQDTFFRAFKHLRGFNFRYKFSTWIHVIASRISYNALRNRELMRKNLVFSHQLFDETAHPDLAFIDPKPLPDEAAEQMDLCDRVIYEISLLPPHQRKILALRGIRDLTYEEICKSTETSLGTVKSRLHKARKEISNRIGPFLS